MRYTIRNVPKTLDEALRRTAREQGKSLNEVVIEALARGAGIAGERNRQRNLGDICWHLAQRFRFRQRPGRARHYRRRDVAVKLSLETNRCTDLCRGNVEDNTTIGFWQA